MEEGLDFVKSEVRILRIRVESGETGLRKPLFMGPVASKNSGVEKAEKTSEETTNLVKITNSISFHLV